MAGGGGTMEAGRAVGHLNPGSPALTSAAFRFTAGVVFPDRYRAATAEDCQMSRFQNVTVVAKANVYFDGKVTSRTVEFPDGSVKTLGIMLPGEYEFNTGKPELMEIQSGRLTWCPAGESRWQEVSGGQSFRVPGNSSFRLQVSELADYICSFL